jgi:integrase
MKVKLTEAMVTALKVPDGATRIEHSDSECRGLSVRVTPSLKIWSYAYKVGGRMRRITVGEYPTIKVEEARELVNEMRKHKRAGTDPAAQRDRLRAAPTAITFDALCTAYVAHIKVRKSSWRNDEGHLKRPRDKFAKRAALSITKAELIALLNEIASEFRVSANRTQTTLFSLFKWATARDSVPANPLVGVEKAGGKENAKERALSTDELKAFFTALDKSDASDMKRRALRLIALTAQRPGEVAGMMLSELHDLDGPKPHWIIPRARTKNKRAEHTVPLSSAAVRLIKEALNVPQDEKPGANDQPVLARNLTAANTLARHQLSSVVRDVVTDNGLMAFTPHDLRRTSATIAQSVRTPVDHVKALLNHHDKGVTGVYARWHYFEEKLAAVLGIESVVSPLMSKAEA